MWLLLLYYDAYVIWDLVLTLFYLCGICDDDFFVKLIKTCAEAVACNDVVLLVLRQR